MVQHIKTFQKNSCTYYQTAAGTLKIRTVDKKISQALFVDELDITPRQLTNEIDISQLFLQGTKFQIKVWQTLLQIPAGKTVSYQELAQMVGHPKAWRAVASAVAQNKISYFIPCHRVVRKNGQLGGYRWGVEKKRALLIAECTTGIKHK